MAESVPLASVVRRQWASRRRAWRSSRSSSRMRSDTSWEPRTGQQADRRQLLRRVSLPAPLGEEAERCRRREASSALTGLPRELLGPVGASLCWFALQGLPTPRAIVSIAMASRLRKSCQGLVSSLAPLRLAPENRDRLTTPAVGAATLPTFGSSAIIRLPTWDRREHLAMKLLTSDNRVVRGMSDWADRQRCSKRGQRWKSQRRLSTMMWRPAANVRSQKRSQRWSKLCVSGSGWLCGSLLRY